MRTDPSLHGLHCVETPALAARVPGVAFCVTRLASFRTLQHTDTVAVWWKIRTDDYLRRRSRLIIAVQFCPDCDKALWRLEIPLRTKKRLWQSGLPHPRFTGFPGKTTMQRWPKAAPNRPQRDPKPPVWCGCPIRVSPLSPPPPIARHPARSSPEEAGVDQELAEGRGQEAAQDDGGDGVEDFAAGSVAARRRAG